MEWKVRDQIKQNEKHETESFNEFEYLLFVNNQ